MTQNISRPVRTQRAPVANVFGPLAKILNPLVARVAGSRFIPLWAVVRHRGRRSGRAFATPVAVAWTDEFLAIPLPFGSGADWCRNVLAAGGCVVRWRGAEREMRDPQVVEGEAGARMFNPVERWFLTALGIRAVLRLRFA